MKKYDNAGRVQTCLTKYGVEHPMQNPEIRKKSQRRYVYSGIKFDSSYDIVAKCRATCMDLYGVDNSMKCEVGLNALIESNMRKYGVLFYTYFDIQHRKRELYARLKTRQLSRRNAVNNARTVTCI